jgi:5-methylthioadenosine/S-adenosylhomocysteine deaminase
VTTGFLLRGGCVLTLGAKNFAEADLLIADGKVAEVGPGLRARDAETVDASDTIVMPGFVDTHRHAWRSLFRNAGGGLGTDAELERLGRHYGPDDVYAATLVGLLGAAEAGVTTVVDFADVALDAASADAALQAHADAGLRTVLALPGADGGVGRDAFVRRAEAAGPSTTVAVGVGAFDGGSADGDGPPWRAARELGLRIHAHAPWDTATAGRVAEAADKGLLGPDVTLVHVSRVSDADLGAISSSGAAYSLAPSSEMAGGLGSPPIQGLIDHEIRPGLGVDDERMAPGDLFAQMRATISLQHATVFDRKLAGKAGVPKLMTTRDVIRFATVDGARVAGLAGVTGSLEVGMQADLIVLRTDRPNIYPINDPIGAVVWGMDTSNLDWVFAAGRPLMREGILEADVAGASTLATAARDRVAAAAGLVAGAAQGGGA